MTISSERTELDETIAPGEDTASTPSAFHAANGTSTKAEWREQLKATIGEVYDRSALRADLIRTSLFPLAEKGKPGYDAKAVDEWVESMALEAERVRGEVLRALSAMPAVDTGIEAAKAEVADVVRSAHHAAKLLVADAEKRSAQTIAEAREEAERIRQEAAETIVSAQRRAAQIDQDAKRRLQEALDERSRRLEQLDELFSETIQGMRRALGQAKEALGQAKDLEDRLGDLDQRLEEAAASAGRLRDEHQWSFATGANASFGVDPSSPGADSQSPDAVPAVPVAWRSAPTLGPSEEHCHEGESGSEGASS